MEASKGHDDHANREVHRPYAVTSPLIQGPDVARYQEAVNSWLRDHKLKGQLKTDGQFGERTAALGDKVAYTMGLEAAGDSPRHISRLVTQDEQHKVRNPSSRTDQEKERAQRRLKEVQQHEQQNGAGHPGSLRDRILEYCQWGVANEPSIHYRQSRPYPSDPKGLPMYTDCSGFATLAYKYAGAPDPNGRNFDGYGYTGTQLTAMRHIPKGEAEPGDLVVYGPYPGAHVVVLKEPGSVADPMTFSHGQEGGPMLVRHSVEVRYHSNHPGTFLTIL